MNRRIFALLRKWRARKDGSANITSHENWKGWSDYNGSFVIMPAQFTEEDFYQYRFALRYTAPANREWFPRRPQPQKVKIIWDDVEDWSDSEPSEAVKKFLADNAGPEIRTTFYLDET